jgi:hypothetical protein
MSSDRSRERRRLAATCLALAKQTSDLRLHAFLLALAQQWLDLAELGSHQQDVWNEAAHFCAIQTTIGRELRAQHEPPQELPYRILMLLMQLDRQQNRKSSANAANKRDRAG